MARRLRLRQCWTATLVQALRLCFFVVMPAMASANQDKIVTLFDVYPACQAAFGDPIPDYGFLNLLLPPSESNETLCEFPRIVWNATNPEAQLPQNVASAFMALLVRTGNCTAEQQARNAAKLRKWTVPQLRYLLIEGPPEAGNMLEVLYPDTNSTEGSPVRSIGVLSTTFRAGEYMRQDIRNVAAATQASPVLFDPENVDWAMLGSIDPYWFKSDSSNAGGPTDNFYWFRVLLFTLLIVSPCLRAAYLWWAGGGRLRLRRNEDGRITGLQYVPPVPYWLSSGMIPGARPVSETTTNTLTEEEFNTLPEIEYKQPEHAERDVDEETGDGWDSSERRESSRKRHSLSASPENDANELVGPDPLEQAPSSSPSSEMHSTCTMCSICIDDFEDGEKLILLPRCRHSFHRDCIHPWVTERQGCCPLCKTNVLENKDHSAGSGDSQSPTNADDDDDERLASLDTSDSSAAADQDGREGTAEIAAGDAIVATIEGESSSEDPDRRRRPTSLPA